MHPLLDHYLCEKYPIIFKERHYSVEESCMGWGIETGDGWFFLIDGLCSSIQWRINNPPYVEEKSVSNKLKKIYINIVRHLVSPILDKIFPKTFCFYLPFLQLKYVQQPIQPVVALQVKEKFGGLRFYYEGGDELIHGMVQLAESLSYRICEKCGVMNELVNHNTKGWIHSTCPCCVSPGMKENHLENRRKDLVEVWTKVNNDKINKLNDRKT